MINEQLIELTRDAVASIRATSDSEIIIIDNGSPMGGGMLRELADLYILNKTNLGYARAVNQGLKLCDRDELVCVSNNDIRVAPNWQEIAIDIMKDPKVATVHYRMIPYDQPFNAGDKVWITGKERWCTGSFFVIRNRWLFDENFLNSYDDWDMHKRMYDEGFKTAYTNKSEYQHMDSFTQQFRPDRNDNDVQNKEYFIKKHKGIPEELWMKMFPEQMIQDYRGGFE